MVSRSISFVPQAKLIISWRLGLSSYDIATMVIIVPWVLGLHRSVSSALVPARPKCSGSPRPCTPARLPPPHRFGGPLTPTCLRSCVHVPSSVGLSFQEIRSWSCTRVGIVHIRRRGRPIFGDMFVSTLANGPTHATCAMRRLQGSIISRPIFAYIQAKNHMHVTNVLSPLVTEQRSGTTVPRIWP